MYKYQLIENMWENFFIKGLGLEEVLKRRIIFQGTSSLCPISMTKCQVCIRIHTEPRAVKLSMLGTVEKMKGNA